MARGNQRSVVLALVKFAIAIVLVTIITSLMRWYLPWYALPMDLFLVTTVFVALRYTSLEALLVGLFAGLSCDVFSSNIIGFNAFSLMTLGYVIASLKDAVLIKGTAQRLITYLAASVAHPFIVSVMSGVFGLETYMDWTRVGVMAAGNLVVGFVLTQIAKKRPLRNEVEDGYE